MHNPVLSHSLHPLLHGLIQLSSSVSQVAHLLWSHNSQAPSLRYFPAIQDVQNLFTLHSAQSGLQRLPQFVADTVQVAH